MKNIKTYEGLFASKFDPMVKDIFEQIKTDINENNKSAVYDKSYGRSCYRYYLKDNNLEIEAKDEVFYINYQLKLNGQEIDCSSILKRKIYKFFDNQRKMEEDRKSLDEIKKFNR